MYIENFSVYSILTNSYFSKNNRQFFDINLRQIIMKSVFSALHSNWICQCFSLTKHVWRHFISFWVAQMSFSFALEIKLNTPNVANLLNCVANPSSFSCIPILLCGCRPSSCVVEATLSPSTAEPTSILCLKLESKGKERVAPCALATTTTKCQTNGPPTERMWPCLEVLRRRSIN